ncbi:hypothetical protein [Pseudomonas sp. 31 R 17]|uniref:hypothetical protein n=1 Tax=Pseudomonas sp. 31 R 17 TaxID=1844101 RepID=UPI00351EFD94
MEGFLTMVKGLVFVAFVLAVALGIFNGGVMVVSAYFGPFYEGDAEQSRNFGIWLVGNGLVALGAVVGGIAGYRRCLRKGQK